MFGTVGRLKGLPGAEPALMAWNQALTSGINGMIHSVVYRSTDEPDVFWLTVVFESEEAYRANAESPEQHRRWSQMRSALAAEIEWHDGQVIAFVPQPQA
ncbi:MAG: hypothetical protein DWI58_14830 [Chloroflexi bacterium]|nr:MAG: hypothetical protein DWI58_14830 [Chloroflexota bacterium]